MNLWRVCMKLKMLGIMCDEKLNLTRHKPVIWKVKTCVSIQ